MKPSELGRLGEDIVAVALGFVRVPASGSRWPHKEDLRSAGWLGQVKTTRSRRRLEDWRKLEENARASGADPRFFEVIVTGQEAHVFEVKRVGSWKIGVGGDL